MYTYSTRTARSLVSARSCVWNSVAGAWQRLQPARHCGGRAPDPGGRQYPQVCLDAAPTVGWARAPGVGVCVSAVRAVVPSGFQCSPGAAVLNQGLISPSLSILWPTSQFISSVQMSPCSPNESPTAHVLTLLGPVWLVGALS